MADQETTSKGTQSSSSGGSQRSTGPFSSFPFPFRNKSSPSTDRQQCQEDDSASSTAQSEVTKETTVSKDSADTASFSPSVKKKETMAAVKTFFSMPLQKTATWIQSPFLSFPTKHRMKNEEIHRIFQELPEEEKLIDDYSCALQRDILLQGRLYITQNWLCFYANIFTWVTLLTIPFKAIQSITKEKTVSLFPYAIHVCTSTDKYGFHSFMQRDASFTVIFRVWQNNLLSESMAMTPLELLRAARKAGGDDTPDDIFPDDLWGPARSSRDRSASSSASLPVDTATLESVATTTAAATTSGGRSTGRQFSMDFSLFRGFRSQKSHSSSEAKSNKLPDIKELEHDNAPPTSDVTSDSVATEPEDNTPVVTKESAATQTSSTESSRKSDPDLMADHTLPADNDEPHEKVLLRERAGRTGDPNLTLLPTGAEAIDVVSMESMKSSDFEFETGSLYDEMGEVLCGCDEHNGNTMMNGVYNCDVETLFQLLFTDHEFFKGFLKSRRTINLEFGEWVSQPDGTKLRDITYTLSLNYSFGPKFSPSTEHQIYSKDGQWGVKHVVANEVVNGNIPYGDSFYVCCRFCLTRVAHNKSRCRVTSNIAFRKSCWGLVKSLIERNAGDGLRSYYSQLDTSLKEYLANLPAKKLHRKPHHRSRSRYRNTPPLTKKAVDLVSLGESAVVATPKSNNSGVATPTAASIGANDSSADKLASSGGAVSMTSVVQKLVKAKEQLPQEEKTQIPRATVFTAVLLCCVLAINLMVYLRLVTSNQSGATLHYSQQGDINFDDLKIKEWPSSHKEWVELVKKQVESHDLEMESWMKLMRSLVDVVDQIQSMAAEIKGHISEEINKRQKEMDSSKQPVVQHNDEL